MLEILLAFGLDRLIGDPPYPWHPVRVIGRFVTRSENWLRARLASAKVAGFLQALFVPTVTFAMVWFFTELAFQIHPFLKRIVSIYFIYSTIAVKDLEKEARQIYVALRNGKLDAARENLSRIVGRDTENLTEEEVTRGAIEAVAESFVDGVLSPLFYAALGGAPSTMAYKAVNTLDSMVGRRTPRYREFGFAAAKLDEMVNWIPARISWFLIGLGAAFVNGRIGEAWYVGIQDGASTSLPNSVVPEAAFAGALGVELGGVNFYEGERVVTPKLGFPMRPIQQDDIRLAYRLMNASSIVSLGAVLILSYVISLIFNTIRGPL